MKTEGFVRAERVMTKLCEIDDKIARLERMRLLNDRAIGKLCELKIEGRITDEELVSIITPKQEKESDAKAKE